MREIEADYLVVGAGASGLAFVDTLLELTDARVVLVDREARPGGHWLHAYPFVRLHQPSANYGVASRRLGEDRVDTEGPNAGFYERARSADICDYFAVVLDGFLANGRVRFLGSSDYRGRDGDAHVVVSLGSGEAIAVRAARLVDATYVASEVPSRHTPPFGVDEGVRLVPPNDLVDLAEPTGGYTVLGAGKTAMDTCVWLLEQGVDPGRVRWVKPREAWLFDRRCMQPLDLVASFMQMQAHWVRAAAAAADGHDFARRLSDDGVLVRVDQDVEPGMFRGATTSSYELELLRTVQDVVRGSKVRRITTSGMLTDGGEVPSRPGEVYVDCTARGVPDTPAGPLFVPGAITLGYVTVGITPYSAATVAAVEATRQDDGTKNGLCPPLRWSGRTADLLELAHAGMTGLSARLAEPDLAAWTESCRLNPAAGGMAKGDDPAVSAALGMLVEHLGPALDNLQRRVGAPG